MVCGPIIYPQRIPIRFHHMPTRKNHVSDIANALIVPFRCKYPFVPPDYTSLRRVQVKEGQAQAIQTASSRLTHTMINHQPTTGGFNRRITQANLVSVPPSST